jgi:hypothetical protein
MSTFAWGDFGLNKSDVSVKKMDELTFKIISLASEKRIGLTLGWYISEIPYKESNDLKNGIPFVIMDNPLINVAELLFKGDGIQIFGNNKRVDSGEGSYRRRQYES